MYEKVRNALDVLYERSYIDIIRYNAIDVELGQKRWNSSVQCIPEQRRRKNKRFIFRREAFISLSNARQWQAFSLPIKLHRAARIKWHFVSWLQNADAMNVRFI